MARKVFLSFHYDNDVRRVAQIKQMGALEGQPLLHANKWEEIKRRGDEAIKRWINDHMRDAECVIVLIGSQTAGRRWVRYEIEKAWGDRKGLMGVYIHNLKDPQTGKSSKGRNPFTGITVIANSQIVDLSCIVRVYDPDPNDAYNDIANNIENWISRAIAERGAY